MALTARVTRGKTFAEGEAVSTDDLNAAALPVVEIEGIADANQVSASFPDYTGTGSDITGQGVVTIVPGAVDTAELADGAVNADKLASDAVITAKILNDAVTNDKLADDAVDSPQIVDASVDLVHLSDEVAFRLNAQSKFHQTVISGPIDSNGYGNCLTDSSGTPRVQGATTNVVAGFSAGFNEGGPVLYTGKVTTNLDSGGSAIGNWERGFVYLDRNSGTGAITCGHTPMRPEVGFDLPTLGSSRETPMAFAWDEAANGTTDTDVVRFFDIPAYQNPFNREFDKNVSSGGVKFNSYGSGSPFVDIVMPRKTQLSKIRVWMPDNSSYFSTSFKIYGSNSSTNGHANSNPDYNSWTLLETITGLTQTGEGVDLDIAYANQAPYLAYKVESTDASILHCTLFQVALYDAFDHFYSISENKMYYDNSGTWAECQRMFVGEISKNSSSWSSTTYAYRGVYESAVQNMGAFTLGTTDPRVEVSHNIGAERVQVNALVRREDGFQWSPARLHEDEPHLTIGGSYYSWNERLSGCQPYSFGHLKSGVIRMGVVCPGPYYDISDKAGSFVEKRHSFGSPFNPFSFPGNENANTGTSDSVGGKVIGNQEGQVKFIVVRDY